MIQHNNKCLQSWYHLGAVLVLVRYNFTAWAVRNVLMSKLWD